VRYASDHKAKTREQLLKVAAREIRAKGPDGVAVAGVMAQAGLTHGGFYAHFKSKDALIEAALEEMFRAATERSEPIVAEADPREALRSYLDFYLSPAHRDARDRGCPLPALSGDFARGDAAGRGRFSTGIDTLFGRLEKVLGRLGVSEPIVDAASVLSEIVGAVALSRATGDPKRSDMILVNVRKALGQRYGLDVGNS
jgi:TetR/AcrR family transcriptional repressor of nem operon